MHRRTFLATTAATATTVGLAGCLSDGGDPAAPQTDSPTPTPSVTDASLTQTDGGCGSQADDASASLADDGSTVTVTGTIWGSDGCTVPVLDDASYDGDGLTVVVTTERRDDAGACVECIVELGYEVTMSLTGDPPSSVTVQHDHDGETTTITAPLS